MNNNKNKIPFSKTLLIQESILIWIQTLAFLALAYLCVLKGFTASLPWLAAMASFPWAAYGVSAAFYYKKSSIENSKDGIIYETALIQAKNSVMNTTTTNTNNNIIDPFGPI